MDAEANKAQKRRYIEAFNAQDLDMIDELFDSRYVLHVPGSPDVEGPETLKQIVAESLATLSEAVLTVDDMVAEGNRVATRWTMTAIHSGNFMGVPPTDQRITMQGMTIDRFVDGKVVEGWDSFDMYGVLKQMGAIPSDD